MRCQEASPAEIELIRELVELRSPSGDEAAVAEHLLSVLTEYGWTAWLDETGNVIGTKGPAGGQGDNASPLRSTLLFLGHIDTMPGWPEVKVENGELWGRGSVDAKGCIAAFLAGVRRFEHSRGILLGMVVFAGAVGEEADSRGARAIVSRYLPEMCVVGEPSGWDAVTVGYRGHMRAPVCLRRAITHQAIGHGTPVEDALALWAAVKSRCEAENPRPGYGFHSLSCSLEDISQASDGLETVVSLQTAWRLPVGTGPEQVEDVLASASRAFITESNKSVQTPGAAVSWERTGYIPPFLARKNNRLVTSFVSAIRRQAGDMRFKLKTGTSDMNIVGPAWGCPIMAYGPGDSSLDHTPEERLSIDEYGRSIAVWQDVLSRLYGA